MVKPSLSSDELVRLVARVFELREIDRTLAFLVDLPDARLPDHPAWAERRSTVADWHSKLSLARADLGLDAVDLVFYRNVRSNNADLPADAEVHAGGRYPAHAAELGGHPTPFAEILSRYQILIAVTELSATAPLKLQAPRYGFRAATMPGFTAAMIPALRLDYGEVQARCEALKAELDPAVAAHLRFEAGGSEHVLILDLRHRSATASGGRIVEPGRAGNLPSGETFIVPYEGERAGDASRSAGVLPLQLGGELLFYRIERNRIREVVGDGPRAAEERQRVAEEPAYANVAELGFGILAGYGIEPIGELLLDEKLGLHVAFGRSDHFGGTVGAADFTAPERVVHIDRVYLSEVQPAVRVRAVDLERPEAGGTRLVPLMRDGAYVD